LFVYIGVTSERKQAGLLVFPSKAAHSGCSSGFCDPHEDEFSPDPATALRRLGRGDILQGVVIDGLHKTVPENVQRHAEGPNVFTARCPFLCFRTDCSIIEQRTIRDHCLTPIDRDAGADKVAVAVSVAKAELSDLASAAGHRILMALRAGSGVVDWSKSLVDSIFLFKNSLCSAKGGIVHQTVAFTLATGIRAKGRCVESGGRFVSLL